LDNSLSLDVASKNPPESDNPPEKVITHYQNIIFLSTFQKGRRIFQAQTSFCGGEFILPEMIEIG
jgi:hypothetical protein